MAVAQGMDITASADGADDLVPALLTAARALVGVCGRSLARVQDAVTITQFGTMVVLQGHGDTRLNQLAERVGVAHSTSLRMVDCLIDAHLVTRRENKADRREVLVALSKGRDWVVRSARDGGPRSPPSSPRCPGRVARGWSRRSARSPRPPAKPHRASRLPPGSAGNHGRLVPSHSTSGTYSSDLDRRQARHEEPRIYRCWSRRLAELVGRTPLGHGPR